MIDAFLRWIYRYSLLLLYKLVAPYKIEGWENLPDRNDGPYLIVANHFSYFEAPLLMALLISENFRAVAALETGGEARIIDSLYRVYDRYLILVNRGRVDRKSLNAGLQALSERKWVFLFPEGGITEEAIRLASMGLPTDQLQEGYRSRIPAVLLPARPGAAMLATRTNAKVLPIAFVGTELIEANLGRWRRTKITMRIGKPLEPMTLPEGVRGRERRAYLDMVGEKIMDAIADLMPEPYRGDYGTNPLEER